MTFINANLWWLALLVLVPILIHLLIRQRLPRVRWAAQTFLLLALRKNRKKMLLETLLLLAVRTSLVLVLVLMVLRPVTQSAWRWLAGERRQVVSVVVVDDSASMAATDGVRSRFERARVRAGQYLDALPGGSEVAVILAGEPPMALLRQPTRDFDYVRTTIASREPRDSGSALADAVIMARDWLSAATTPNREIVILTDMQESDIERQDDALRTALAEVRATTSVFLAPIHSSQPNNVAIVDLHITAGPATPPLATTLWPTPIRTVVRTYHHREPVDTAVELFVDKQKVSRQRITLPPGEETTVMFEHHFSSPGQHAVSVRCDADLFERDNERFVVADVREQFSALLIDGHMDDDPFKSATGFLHIALWPMSPDEANEVPCFDIRVVDPGGLETVRIADFQLIVIADVSALPMGALRQIRAAVRDGAGLLVVAGPQMTSSSITAMFADGGEGPLPIQLAEPIDLDKDAEPLRLVLLEPLVPALAAFEDATLAEALSQAGWHTARPVADVTSSGLQRWANFGDAGAAMVAGQYGKGRVVYFGGALSRHGTEFPLSPAFVPFVQQLAFHLVTGTDSSTVAVGQSAEFPVDGREPTLVYPDGSSEPAAHLIVTDSQTGRSSVLLDATHRAGIHTIRCVASDGRNVRYSVAANIPRHESDLSVLEADALKDTPLELLTLIGPEEEMRAALRSSRGKSELWPLAMILVLALLAAEVALVWWFTPRPVDTEAMLKRATQL